MSVIFSASGVLVSTLRVYFFQRIGRFADPDPPILCMAVVTPCILIHLTCSFCAFLPMCLYMKYVYDFEGSTTYYGSIFMICLFFLHNFITFQLFNSKVLTTSIQRKKFFETEEKEHYIQIMQNYLVLGLIFPPIIVLAQNLKYKIKSVFYLNFMKVFVTYVIALMLMSAQLMGANFDPEKQKQYYATTNFSYQCESFSFEKVYFHVNIESWSYIIYFLPLVTVLTSPYLDYFGNYYNIYKSCCGPIHYSLLQDLLINEDLLDPVMKEESRRIFDAALKSDIKIFNQKDFYCGKSWYYLALNLKKFDLIDKVLDAQGNVCDEHFFELLEDMKQEKDNQEVKNKLCALENRVTCPIYTSTWQKMHLALKESSFSNLIFQTVMGGLWDSRDEHNQTLFDCIIEKLEKEEIKLSQMNFVVKYFILNTCNIKGQSIVHIAAMKERNKFLEKLIQDEPKEIEKYSEKEKHTPLHLAVLRRPLLRNKIECVKFLLEKNCNVNVQDLSGKTPLHMAIKEDHVNCVPLLIEKGADLSLKNYQGLSPLHLAVKLGRIEHIKCIVDYINERVRKAQEDSFYTQTSSIAKGEGRESVNKVKWNRKLADTMMNEQNYNDNSLLQVASMNGNIEIIKILAENGADVNKIDWFGNTPLHHVLSMSEFSINEDDREKACTYLLKAKADFTRKNLKGMTPLDSTFLKSLKIKMPELFEENFMGEIERSQTFFGLPGLCLCMFLKRHWFLLLILLLLLIVITLLLLLLPHLVILIIIIIVYILYHFTFLFFCLKHLVEIDTVSGLPHV